MDIFDGKAKDAIEEMYLRLESRINELSNQLKENFLPNAVEKMRSNIFKTVIISFFIGVVAGALFVFFGVKNKKRIDKKFKR